MPRKNRQAKISDPDKTLVHANDDCSSEIESKHSDKDAVSVKHRHRSNEFDATIHAAIRHAYALLTQRSTRKPHPKL